MVTKRNPAAFNILEKAKSLECIKFFGRKDITINTITETFNQSGRLASRASSSATNQTGDLQFDPLSMKEYINWGVAKIGDGVFYSSPDITITQDTEIVVDSITWRMISQVEGEQTDGVTIYQGWIVRRKP